MLESLEEHMLILKVFSFARYGVQANCSSPRHLTVHENRSFTDSTEGKSRSCGIELWILL